MSAFDAIASALDSPGGFDGDLPQCAGLGGNASGGFQGLLEQAVVPDGVGGGRIRNDQRFASPTGSATQGESSANASLSAAEANTLRTPTVTNPNSPPSRRSDEPKPGLNSGSTSAVTAPDDSGTEAMRLMNLILPVAPNLMDQGSNLLPRLQAFNAGTTAGRTEPALMLSDPKSPLHQAAIPARETAAGIESSKTVANERLSALKPPGEANAIASADDSGAAKAQADAVPSPPALAAGKGTSPVDQPATPGGSGETGDANQPLASAGMSAANQNLLMKKAENAIKAAGQTEKVLPGKSISAMGENNLPMSANRMQSFLDNGAKMAEAETDSGTTALSEAAVTQTSDARIQAADRAHELVALHAVRFAAATAESLQIVIKPGAGTQLSLELRQRNGGIEAQAVLQQGDFHALNQHWSELQQRLEQRGIKLAPLQEDGGTASAMNGGNAQDQRQFTAPSALDGREEPVFAGPSGRQEPEVALAESGVAGWQSWA